VGEIDFAEALDGACALAGLPASVLDDVRSRLRLTPVRERCFARCSAGLCPAVVSGGFVEVLAPLMAELQVEHLAANRLEIVEEKLSGHSWARSSTARARPRRCVVSLTRWAYRWSKPWRSRRGERHRHAVDGRPGYCLQCQARVQEHGDAQLSVPYLDAVLYFLGISREKLRGVIDGRARSGCDRVLFRRELQVIHHIFTG